MKDQMANVLISAEMHAYLKSVKKETAAPRDFVIAAMFESLTDKQKAKITKLCQSRREELIAAKRSFATPRQMATLRQNEKRRVHGR